MMDAAVAPFRELVAQVSLQAPRIPYVSNLTGTWITAAEATDPDYWARHLRQTVRFADGLGELLREPDAVLLEVGPGRTLSALAGRHPHRATARAVVPSLGRPRDPRPEVPLLLAAAGKLWLAGVKLDAEAMHAGRRHRRVPLPTYPFERQRYWVAPRSPAVSKGRPELGAPPEIPRDVPAGWTEPHGAREREVAALWRETLGIEWVGAHDDFFELGGHSLMATRLVSRLRDRFGVEVPIDAFFEAPTVAGLARRIAAAAGGAAATPMRPVPRDGGLPLSFAQQRLWFLTQLEPASPWYNMPLAVRFQGPLDPALLERAADRDPPPSREPAHHLRPARRGAGAGRVPTGALQPAGGRSRRDLSRRDHRPSRGGAAAGRGGGAAPLRPPAGAALAPAGAAAGRRGPRGDADPAPHRFRRLVGRPLPPRADGLLRRLGAGGGAAPAAAAGPVRGLRRLAARLAHRRRPGRPDRLLAGAAGWRPAGVGAAARPPAPAAADLPRRSAPPGAASGARGAAAGPRPGARRHPVHGPAGRVQDPAPALHRPGGPAGGRAHRRPQPQRDRGADRVLRQHPRPAHRSRGRSGLRGAPGPGPRDHGGRLCPPGLALREAGRGGQAPARPGTQPAVPGDARPGEQPHGQGHSRLTGGPRRHPAGGRQRRLAFRVDPVPIGAW